MTLDTHNWSSSAHQEIHKILKEEIFPIINQVDSRLQNFEIQFLKEAAEFVLDFKSLTKEADESLAKHKALELEIERLLRAVVSQDIISIVQNPSVIEWLQAQLGDPKGKSKDTSCVLDTLDPLPQKLENENVELEYQLRAQLFDKVSDQVDTTKGTSTNTKFANQKVDETNDLSKPVTSNSVPTPQESKSVKHDNVIAPGMFRINPLKPSREEKYVPNKVRAHQKPQPKEAIQMHEMVPHSSKSSCNKNKEVEVEEHHRNLLLSKNKKHMSSECKHVKLDIRNDKSEVSKKQKANVSNTENQKKQKPKVKKPMKVGSNERLASPKPSKPRFCLRWSPTGRIFDITGKIIASSESESQSDCSNDLKRGVEFVKRKPSTNLNFHQSPLNWPLASPICLMDRATSPRQESMWLTGTINQSSGLDLTYAPSTITTQKPTEGELDLLFEAMYDTIFCGQPSSAQELLRCSSTSSSSLLQRNYNRQQQSTAPTNSSSQATIVPNTTQDVG
ncbi:hypothetical protein Tco_0881059 [Tanacetum coccineum]